MNTQNTIFDIEKLQLYAIKSLLPKIKRCSRLPIDAFTDNDILCQIWISFNLIANNYKEGESNVESYCFKYAYQLTVQNLWRQYKRENNYQKRLMSIDLLDHHSGWLTLSDHELRIYSNISNRVQKILAKMSTEDRKIAIMYMDGMTFRMISDIIGISHIAVQKRLRKYRNIS